MASGTLEVILLQGKDLKDVEKLGKQSPYCIFVCGDIRTRSQACKDGARNPVWKEAFAFEITNQVELGILVMSEHKNSKDATIGASHIPLTEVEGKGWVDVTTPVTVNKSGKSQGALMLQMRYRMNHGDMSNSMDSSQNMMSPYRQTASRYNGPTSPPNAVLTRGISSEFRDLSNSSGSLRGRLGQAEAMDRVRSPEVLVVNHNNHFDTMHELPSASSSNSNINLEDSAASGVSMVRATPSLNNHADLEARLADMKLAEGRYDTLSRMESKHLESSMGKQYSRHLDRQQSKDVGHLSVSNSVEFDSLKRQLTEMTQQKAALEAALNEREEEATALKNKISTISSMSFKDRKNWIEEKEHFQLELLTLKQQLGEQMDPAVLKQQHDEVNRLRARVTELESDLTQQKSIFEQTRRMSADQMIREHKSGLQDAVQQVEDLNQQVMQLYETHSQLVGELEGHLDNTTTELASSLSNLQREKAELLQMVQQLRESHAAAPRGPDPEEVQSLVNELKLAHAANLAALEEEKREVEEDAARQLQALQEQHDDLLEEKMELQKLAEEVMALKSSHVFMPKSEHEDLLSLKSRCAHLEQTSEGKMLELSKLLQETEKHLSSMEKERDELRISLNTTQIECQKLQEATSEHKSHATELAARLTELEAQLGEAKQASASQAAELGEADSKLERALRERFELQKEVGELKQKLQEAKEHAEAGMASMKNQLDGLATSLEENKALLTSERERAEKAEQMSQDAQAAAEKAERDLGRAREEIAEVQVKVMVLDSDIKTVRDSLDQAQAGKDAAEKNFQELKHQSAKQKEQLQEQIEEQRAEILSMARERDAATKSLKSLQEHVQAQTGKTDETLMKELLEKNFELEMTSEDIKHENDVLTQELVSTKLELARLREVETLFRREVYKAKVAAAPNGRGMVA